MALPPDRPHGRGQGIGRPCQAGSLRGIATWSDPPGGGSKSGLELKTTVATHMVNEKQDPEPIQALDELDIEQFVQANPRTEKPHAKLYVIRVDRHVLRVRERALTGTQILALVNLTPRTHKLYQKFRGQQPVEVGPNELVSFVAPGVERFVTIPCDTTEGAHA